MFCPTCFLPDIQATYICFKCQSVLCEECATFAIKCRNTLCQECTSHECLEENCTELVAVNMTVTELLRVFCGETLPGDSNWERIGKEYDPFQIRIYQAGNNFYTTGSPCTNLFSFPQILDVRVFNVSEYSLVAFWVWRKLIDANRVVHTFSDYEDKIRRLDTHDFICWYTHRSLSKYSTFEDRVFIRSTKYLRLLKSLDKPDELEELVSRLKEKLLLKNEQFYIRELSPLSK